MLSPSWNGMLTLQWYEVLNAAGISSKVSMTWKLLFLKISIPNVDHLLSKKSLNLLKINGYNC